MFKQIIKLNNKRKSKIKNVFFVLIYFLDNFNNDKIKSKKKAIINICKIKTKKNLMIYMKFFILNYIIIYNIVLIIN